MTYVIAEPRIDVKDKACVEVCPVDCIYEGEHQLFIHPDECIDCGACEPVCPVTAIFVEEQVPEQSKQFIELNKQFFVQNPGGAALHHEELITGACGAVEVKGGRRLTGSPGRRHQCLALSR